MQKKTYSIWVRVMVLSATLDNILAISWW